MRERGASRTSWAAGRRLWLAGLACLAATGAAGALPAVAGAHRAASRRVADSVRGIPGLPTGVPPAAIAKPPALPVPSHRQWPFPSAFSYTEGAGRLDGGATLWTDFIYDDHGAFGSPIGIAAAAQVSGLAPVHGGFTYPSGAAHQNGADIFTAAVGYTRSATYWRVDWNTLVNRDIPVAEWTIAADHTKGAPGTATAWPGNAGVTTATGIQYALIVTAKGARLIGAADPAKTIASFPTTVNTSSRSFIVRIPTKTLPVSGTWKLQLAAGLANSAGDGFATVPTQDGGTGNGVNVYNITFRTYRQEAELVCPTGPYPDPALAQASAQGIGVDGVTYDHLPVTECGNFWMENDQANTLAGGNVAKYYLSVNWRKLEQHVRTPQPTPTGYTNRWYVTPLRLGQGVVKAASSTYTGPTYLGRVQAYAVYVPTGYRPGRETKLTWILHSLGANLNQYGGVAPSQLKEECQDRDSICATTEGFSDGQWYYADAEVDFWDVWHQLALTYDLNPDTTVMSGYSMGGWASYKLPEEYPDLFAQSMALEGPVVCGLRVYGSVEGAAGAGQCTKDGDSTPLIVNLRWIPYVMTYGGIDELVPFTGGQEQVAKFRSLKDRFYALDYPAEDHMVFSVQNDFTPADAQLKSLSRVHNPGSFEFTWYPNLVGTIGHIGRAGRIGPTQDYWISGLTARDKAPGKLASLTADSSALHQTRERATEHLGTYVSPGQAPAAIDRETWSAVRRTAVRQLLTLSFTNVARASVNTVRAGLKCATIRARTDGPTTLTLLRLRHDRHRTVHLRKGTTTLHLCTASARRPAQDPRFTG